MPRGGFCSQLCYYLSFSWCWRRDNHEEGEIQVPLLLSDNEEYRIEGRDVDTRINNQYYSPGILLNIEENNLPIPVQTNEIEPVIENFSQSPERLDKEFIVKDEITGIKKRYDADKIISKSLYEFYVKDNDAILDTLVRKEIESQGFDKQSLLQENELDRIQRKVVNDLKGYDDNIGYLSERDLKWHFKKVKYIKFDYEEWRWKSDISYISGSDYTFSESYKYNYKFRGDMRNKEYSEDQANRRLDSFAYVIHEVIRRIIENERSRLEKFRNMEGELKYKIEKGTLALDAAAIELKKRNLELKQTRQAVQKGQTINSSLIESEEKGKSPSKQLESKEKRVTEQKELIATKEEELEQLKSFLSKNDSVNVKKLDEAIQKVESDKREAAKCIAVAINKKTLFMGLNGGSNVEYVKKAMDLVLNKVNNAKDAKSLSTKLKKFFIEPEKSSIWSESFTPSEQTSSVKIMKPFTKPQSLHAKSEMEKIKKGSKSSISSQKKKIVKSEKLEEKKSLISQKKVGLSEKLERSIDKFVEYVLLSDKGIELYKIIRPKNIQKYKIIINGEEYDEENYNPEENRKLHAEVGIIDYLRQRESQIHNKEHYIGNNKKACPGCYIAMSIYQEDEERAFGINWRGDHKDFRGIAHNKQHSSEMSSSIDYVTPQFINYEIFKKRLVEHYKNKNNGDKHDPTTSSSSSPSLLTELESIKSGKFSQQSTKNWNKYNENTMIAGQLIATMKKMTDEEGCLLFGGFDIVLVREGQEFNQSKKNTIGITVNNDQSVQIHLDLSGIPTRSLKMAKAQLISDLQSIFQDLDNETLIATLGNINPEYFK